MNKTSINEYILVYKEYLKDHDKGKEKRLDDIWEEMSIEDKMCLDLKNSN